MPINQKLFYQKKIQEYGATPQGLAWNSIKTQEKRFSIINLLLGDIKEQTLVDAGCGFGDFYLYLKRYNNLPFKYIGIDLLDEMVRIASKRTNTKIIRRNILSQTIPIADWYIASGSMNLLSYEQSSIFIKRCYEHSKKGFIFNILEGRERKGDFTYWSPYKIKKLLNNMGIQAKIIQGYLEEDMTLLLYP